MLKKTGGGGFKPRVPIARRRPQPSPAAASSTSTAPATEPELSTTPAQEATPQPSQDITDSPGIAESRPEPSQPPRPSAQQTHPEQQKEAPPSVAEPATPSSAPDTPASSRPRVAKSSQGTTSTVNPTPTAQASTSAADSSLPTPAEDTLTPSIEIDEASSAIDTTTKGQGKAKAQPRKPAAPKQPRKRKATAISSEGEAETGAEETGAESEAGPAKKTKTAPRKRVAKKKTVTNGADGQSEAEGGQDGATTASRKRSQKTQKRAPHVQEGERALGTASDNNEDEEQAQRSAAEDSGDVETTKTPKKPRRKRSATPEDAENIQIDPQTMTLAELTKNMRTGKRWEKAHLIEQVEQERKREMQKRRLIKLGKLKEGEDLPNEDGSEAGGTPAPVASSTPVPVAPPKSPAPPPLPAGPQMRVVNGVMVVDETTTQYDRYAEADAERENYESKEEHEFSRRTTQRTNMTRKPQANFWAPEETEKFYYGLRMFGTDFGMIAKMFGGAKSRRQVKLKFNREERANPVGVNKCIIGEKDVVMDLDAVGGGEGLEESADIKDELLREQNEREAQAKALEDEVAAEARRKREELMGKRKGDRGKGNHDVGEMEVVDEDVSAPVAAAATKGKNGVGRTRDPETLPGAKYGVGTDPDVIDETDLPAPATRGGRRGRGGRGGRRGGKAQIFASGIGAD